MKKFFGTDGIRGKVGDAPITADVMLKLGWAAGKALAGEKGGSVLIGKDTRISGYMFESALEAGLSSAGTDIQLLGPMPTPAIAYLTRTLNARAGIVISASHNPFQDNGVKFFSGSGEKLSDDVEHNIEAMLEEAFETVSPDQLGKASRVSDAPGRYIEYCKSRVSDALNLSEMHIVVDCAHGATYQVGPKVFEELGARVTTLFAEPDGFNINHECGSTHPQALSRAVQALGADLGIAFDGDGDRVILVDHQGHIIDGDQMLFVLASQWQAQSRLLGGVVGTLMSNYGLELALQDLDIPFARSQVGDRHVHRMLVEKNWTLGGEASGHILCLDRTSTGDGIISALQVLEVMHETEKTLFELTQDMQCLPQVMVNVPIREKIDLDQSPAIQAAAAETEQQINGKGRLVLRASGTEPLIRVMIEHQSLEKARLYAEQVADVVSQSVGAN